MMVLRVEKRQENGLGAVHVLPVGVAGGLTVAVEVVLWTGDTVGVEQMSELSRRHFLLY